MKAHRLKKSALGIAACLLILGNALLTSPAVGEAPPNPFGAVDGATPPNGTTDFQPEEDDFGGGANSGAFGFDNSPPPQGGGSATPPPGNNAATPPPVRLNTAPPAKTTFTPPPRNATPSGKAQTKPAPKLADYLELDPSVKGLEVKNFDLPDKDIKDVVTLISKWTGKNFILDSKVRGKITILGPSQVTLQEAYQAFLSALDANGLTTVQAGKFIRIIESAEARRAPVKTYSGDYAPKDDQFITRIFQLKYINADEVQREFRDLTTRQGKLFAYEPTNSIIITDTGSNIQRIREILDVLDIKGFETTLHVLRIKNGSSKTIAEMLGEIYGEKSQGGQPRTFRRSALERTRGGGVIAKIIPDEATNSLVVLANAAGFVSLQQLVGKLDVKVADTGRIHVYYCEYAKAEDLASTLASLAGNGGGNKSGSKKSGPTTPTPGAPGGTPGGGGALGGSSGPVSAELGDGVKVTSDAPTNALVITANSADYQTLKKVIRKLDIPRLQVFVESAIMEIAVNDSTSVGVNAALGAPGIGFAGGFVGDAAGLAAALTNGLPSAGASIPLFAGPSFNAQVNVAGAGQTPNYQNVQVRTFMGLLKLLTTNTNTSLLSTPQILALDNEKAEFKVQDETPVQSSATAATSTSGAVQNIERLKTGISIKLTPHINASSGNIRLEIEQQVDNIKNSTSATPSSIANINVATTSRVTNTQVVVKDQDYVMLGGLMSDKIDDQVTKVPLLGDIPILGWLFKSKSRTVSKTNLVILLHPKIIGTTVATANLATYGLDKRDQFIDKNLSGGDEFADEVKNLRAQIKRQSERGKTERNYDYRNNEEEEDRKSRPGEESELNGAKNSPKTNESSNANRSAPKGSESQGNGDNTPLLGSPGEAPPPSTEAGG